MSIEKQFTESIAFRTQFDKHFDLDADACEVLESTFRKTCDQAMQEPFFSIRQNVCTLAKSFADDNTAPAYSYQCLADSHVFLNACIAQAVVQEKYLTLTVGDVAYRGESLFNTTRTTLHDAIASGISTEDKPRFHVWLTLADMTIIDFSILTVLGSGAHAALGGKSNQGVNIWRPERKGPLEYYPLLVDDEFLARLQRPSH
ncbi:MAG: hypothetical protein AB8B63_18100 [Granulosicoccus sp.]